MKRQTKAIIYYAILALLYLLLEVILPANKLVTREYALDSVQYHVLVLMLALPIIAIWFAAFYGYSKLKTYASLLGEAQESIGFNKVANGFMWLAWGLPVPTIISLILNGIANSNSNFHSSAIIAVNYVSVLIPLIAFYLIARGVRLIPQRKTSVYALNGVPLSAILYLIFSALYIWLTIKHFSRIDLNSMNNPYFLPFWTVLISITIPYLIAWFLGLYAALRFAFNSSTMEGLLYKRALITLAIGIVAVVISFVALQYLGSVVPRTGHLSLNANLATTYGIRVVSAAGYLSIAVGAQRLKMIEEV